MGFLLVVEGVAAPGGVGLDCLVWGECAGGCVCADEVMGVEEGVFDLGWMPRSLYNPEPGLIFFSIVLLVGEVPSAGVDSPRVRLSTCVFKSEAAAVVVVVVDSDVGFVALDMGLATLSAAPNSPPGRGSFFSRGLDGVEVGDDVATGVDEEVEDGAGGREAGDEVTVCWMRCRRACLGSALGSVDEGECVVSTGTFSSAPISSLRSPSSSCSSSSSQSLASSCSFSALLLSFLFKFFFCAADNEGNCPLLVKSGGPWAKKEEDDCDVDPGTNDLRRADWAEDWLRYLALSSSGVKPGRTFSSLRMLEEVG